MSRSTGRPRLDPRYAAFIAAVYFARLATQQQLARFIGCSQATVSRIVRDA